LTEYAVGINSIFIRYVIDEANSSVFVVVPLLLLRDPGSQ
jgi:hypothetical protein